MSVGSMITRTATLSASPNSTIWTAFPNNGPVSCQRGTLGGGLSTLGFLGRQSQPRRISRAFCRQTESLRPIKHNSVVRWKPHELALKVILKHEGVLKDQESFPILGLMTPFQNLFVSFQKINCCQAESKMGLFFYILEYWLFGDARFSPVMIKHRRRVLP